MILKEWKINQTKVQIGICDITRENVDVIVNAANTNLRHGGGVAWAIARTGGKTIQEESDEYIRKYGPVPTGSVAVTSGGLLKAKYVIHAVGPIWKGGTANEDELLFKAVYNSLLKAQELKATSISLPAISTGIYGFPKDRAAAIFGKAIKKFLENYPDTSIKLIRICHLDQASGEIFIKNINL